MQAKRHGGRVPVDDHADEREQRDAAQFGKSELGQRAAVLGREIGQVVGELVKPVHA
jgi:hypothetical protein